MEKIKIAELEFNYDNAIKTLAALQDAIRNLKTETASLEKENEILRAAGRQDTEQYQKNAKAIETNKIAMSGLQKEYKDTQTVISSAIAAKDEEMGTIKKLEARNKELRTSLRNLNLETEAGQKQQKLYIAEINKNTEFIKKNSDAAIQQKMNIGNYKSALDLLPGSMKNVANGFQMAGNAAKAFLANPVVLVIVGIISAVAGLVKAFKNTEEGGDRLKKLFDEIKAVISVVTDRIENFALGIAKVFSGEQKLKDLKGTFRGMGDEIQRDVRLAGQLRDMMESLENKEIDLLVMSSSRRTEINRLREAAADQNKTEAEKIALLSKANGLITSEAEAQQKVLLTKIANKLGTTDLEAAERRLNEVRNEGKQITLEEIGLSNSTNEDRRELNELIAQYIDLEGQSYMQKKEISSQISGLLKQQKAEQEALNGAVKNFDLKMVKDAIRETEEGFKESKKFMEEWSKSIGDSFGLEIDKNLENIDKEALAIIANITSERDLELEMMADLYEQKKQMLRFERDDEIANAKLIGADVLAIEKRYAILEEQVEKEKQLAKLNILAGFTTAIAGIFDEETKLGKAAAIIQTVINTYKGAMAAFAETPGGIVIKSLAAGTAIATGIAAVRKIIATGKDAGGSAPAIAGLPGSAGTSTEVAVSPSSTMITAASATQNVLVIEDYQRVANNAVKVRLAAEL